MIFIPSSGACSEGVVVERLVVFNKSFDADVTRNVVSSLFEQQRCKEPAHPAIAIVEGMNANKIEDKAERYKEGIANLAR